MFSCRWDGEAVTLLLSCWLLLCAKLNCMNKASMSINTTSVLIDIPPLMMVQCRVQNEVLLQI